MDTAETILLLIADPQLVVLAEIQIPVFMARVVIQEIHTMGQILD